MQTSAQLPAAHQRFSQLCEEPGVSLLLCQEQELASIGDLADCNTGEVGYTPQFQSNQGCDLNQHLL